MPAQWRIEYWPPCVAHAFLSHCAEDRRGLVLPVFHELQRRGVFPWIDRHHYPKGRDPFEALREELLKCRHVVYFITPAMLRQGRGWTSAERAYATTIQQRLRYGDAEIAHVELPLLFVNPADRLFQRSVWRSLVDKAQRAPHAVRGALWRRAWEPFDSGVRRWRDEHVHWAASQIGSFVRQEEEWAADIGTRLGQDSRLHGHFSDDENLMRRILAQAPRPLANPPLQA